MEIRSHIVGRSVPFRLAALNGHTAIIQYLETHLYPAEKKVLVSPDDLSSIILAAKYGHTATYQYLETHLSLDQRKRAAHESFRRAAENGHTTTLQHLITHLLPKEITEAVKEYHCYSIRRAAKNGHTATIQYLMTYLLPEEITEEVQQDIYDAIKLAAENGHTATIQYLITHLLPNEITKVVPENIYGAIERAADNGHTATIQYLMSHLSCEERTKAVQSGNYHSVRYAATYAAKKGDIAIIQYLMSHLSADERKQAVMAAEFCSIRNAAEYGHLATIQYLESYLTDNEKNEAVVAQWFKAIRNARDYAAARFRPPAAAATLYHFFKLHRGIAYAEMHVPEFGGYVLHYVTEQLTSLRAAKEAFETANTHGVFDVSEKEAICLYYMARHLIRRNRNEYREDLLFLLELPRVKNLAHRSFDDGETRVSVRGPENELLRLALDLRNQMAASLLLAIPAVKDLARTNDYYRRESRGGLDLRALAADTESQGEQQQLALAYEAFIGRSSDGLRLWGMMRPSSNQSAWPTSCLIPDKP
jgi:hypothetical protein